MGNIIKPSFDTSVETQLGEKYRGQSIIWKHVNSLHPATNITLDGGGNIKKGGHYSRDASEGYYNKHNYKLVIYKNDNISTGIILGVNSIKELIDKKNLLNANIPISPELYNKIKDGLATAEELVPTIDHIAKVIEGGKGISVICRDNPGDCGNMRGGNRKKSKKTRKISRNKRK